MEKINYQAIRAAYEKVLPKLMDGKRHDPYGIVCPVHENFFREYLTPIEWAVWCEIRGIGIPMYPQFPVGKYFVDFGAPARRVAIECDGAQWHKDKKRDSIREQSIRDRGWKVYRFSGAECKDSRVEYFLSEIARDDFGMERPPISEDDD